MRPGSGRYIRRMAQPDKQADSNPGRDRLKLLGLIHGYWISQVVRAAADLRLAEHLADGPLTAAQVAAIESSDPAATYRLMRACLGVGLLSDDGDGRFGVTPLGALLREGAPGSLRDTALVFGAPAHWLTWGQLPAAVRTGESRAAAALGADLFDYLASQPAEAAQFSGSMAELTSANATDAANVIDVAGGSLAVDVGGATGELVRALLRANPGLHGMVLDLPQAASAAEQAAREDGLGDRFTGVPGDFFASVPAADLYLLKAVLHDWDDASCLKILRNCREAARPGARLMVIENVILDPARDRFASLLDLNMLVVTTGQERELAAYDELFAASGWKRTAIHPLSGGRSLLELQAAG